MKTFKNVHQRRLDRENSLRAGDNYALGVESGFVPVPPPPKENGICSFCNSEWKPDSRGNCGACGAPKGKALA